MSRWNQQGFQDVYTDIASRLVSYHDLTIVTMVALAVGISYFLVSCFSSKYWFKLIKKNEKVEFWWTILPAIWLIFLSYPSLTNLYRMECQGKAPAVAMVEVVGHQWYWSYSYSMASPYFGDSFVEGAYHKRALSPSYSRWGLVEEFALKGYKQSEYSFDYDSYMLGMEDIKEGDYRLLEVDKRVVVPMGEKVLVSVTSADVLHSWCVPSMGIKMDAVPGKHNLVQFNPRRCGVFYGQCSELCGVNHSFMPIVLEVVPEGEFLKWAGIQSYLNSGVTYPLASLRVQWPTVEYDHKFISYWPQSVQDKVLSAAVKSDG